MGYENTLSRMSLKQLYDEKKSLDTIISEGYDTSQEIKEKRHLVSQKILALIPDSNSTIN